ncbi:MAG: hypothetical protein KKI16_07135 [Alphaproteobacteria bacterium]|nr:hypothetical protein [Alphaproteobacteria bacterium]
MMAHAPQPKTVALFYDGFEKQAHDHPFGRLRSDLRGQVRQGYRALRGVQPYTGFYTAFLNLCRSLQARGIEVRVNDFSYARRNPDMPIGLSGYGSVYDRVNLPNPAMFGPGYVPAPKPALEVVQQCNLKIVTLPSEWPCKIWRPTLGDRVHPMFVAIDTDAWPDLGAASKDIDVLIYDKFRWDREARVADILTPLQAHFGARGLSSTVLRYGHHHARQFRAALTRARCMVFLCEHETQGLAYQEALSSGVPILAWDEGELVDPYERKIAPPGLKVSSVPYFDARCGMTFQKADLITAFDRFWGAVPDFAPRDYVLDELSLDAGASRFLSLLGRVHPN